MNSSMSVRNLIQSNRHLAQVWEIIKIGGILCLLLKTTRVNIFAISTPPGGWEEISKYPENGEEIGDFYCLAVKNGEEIRRR